MNRMWVVKLSTGTSVRFAELSNTPLVIQSDKRIPVYQCLENKQIVIYNSY